MKRFCPLASGSKGNSLYISNGETQLLIDVGISFKALSEKLGEIDVDMGEIDAILVTHEHGDHIRGVERTAQKLDIPIFANSETAKATLKEMKSRPRFKIFSTGESFEYGGMEIHPFSIQHDTLDPVAFTIEMEGTKFGICADLGFVTTLVKARLVECDYLYLEANHEPSMVYACNRPPVYKQRVLGRQGHLSNDACAELLQEIDHPGLKHVYLAHLSSECNNPELALKKVREKVERELSLSIAYQEKISHLIEESLGHHKQCQS
ncbi:MBL fold metallo-hydrolase [Candidatus Neptunochlamydia vexilliferae]|uniref:Metallo-hydrolase YycJ n=1 Tax=Candidatus Neptunichlamydia vexilliferae TaxID=1651774 RepID=A0ABS0B0I2_9BACT|nr:MBL fold metallo-hydrolase [Candidatus Neptunochlamydia vexilliferae]MBF5059900.1 putative metallo-hydrolase YycJ [Candidatus Neptunochlamydia vexilliferae]